MTVERSYSQSTALLLLFFLVYVVNTTINTTEFGVILAVGLTALGLTALIKAIKDRALTEQFDFYLLALAMLCVGLSNIATTKGEIMNVVYFFGMILTFGGIFFEAFFLLEKTDLHKGEMKAKKKEVVTNEQIQVSPI